MVATVHNKLLKQSTVNNFPISRIRGQAHFILMLLSRGEKMRNISFLKVFDPQYAPLETLASYVQS
jgi:hypothetical protein